MTIIRRLLNTAIIIFTIQILISSCVMPISYEDEIETIPPAYHGTWLNNLTGTKLIITESTISGIMGRFADENYYSHMIHWAAEDSRPNPYLNASNCSHFDLRDGILDIGNYYRNTEDWMGNGSIKAISSDKLEYAGGSQNTTYIKIPDQTIDVSGSVDFISTIHNSRWRSLSSLGNINLIVQTLDGENEQEISGLSDEDDFTISDISTGVPYTITAIDPETDEAFGKMEFTAEDKGHSLGRVFVTSADYLIKIQRTPSTQFLIGDGKDFDIGFNVFNYGTELSPASIVQVSSPTLTLSGTQHNLGSLEADSSQPLQFSVSLTGMTEFKEIHRVYVTVTDGNSVEWNDHFDLTFYKDYYTYLHWIYNVSSSSPGDWFTVITPDGSLQKVSKGYGSLNGKIWGGFIPRFQEPFQVVFSGAFSSHAEHKRLFSLNINPNLFYGSLDAVFPTVYEPNDSVNSNENLFENSALLTYVSSGDTDIFSILLSSLENVSGTRASQGTFSDRVELSWTPTAGAESYNIFRYHDESDETHSQIRDWIYDPYDFSTWVDYGYKINDEPITGTSFIDFDVELGEDYEYTIQAVSSTLGNSAVSTENAVAGWIE